MPKTRAEFWGEKFEKNVNRDNRVKSDLRKNGWQSLTIWQCELRDPDALARRLNGFLAS